MKEKTMSQKDYSHQKAIDQNLFQKSQKKQLMHEQPFHDKNNQAQDYCQSQHEEGFALPLHTEERQELKNAVAQKKSLVSSFDPGSVEEIVARWTDGLEEVFGFPPGQSQHIPSSKPLSRWRLKTLAILDRAYYTLRRILKDPSLYNVNTLDEEKS